MGIGGEYLKPKGLSPEQLHKARTEKFEFVNPPANEQFGSFHNTRHDHGEFPSMEKVTGKQTAADHRKTWRDRYGGLSEVDLARKGRPF